MVVCACTDGVTQLAASMAAPAMANRDNFCKWLDRLGRSTRMKHWLSMDCSFFMAGYFWLDLVNRNWLERILIATIRHPVIHPFIIFVGTKIYALPCRRHRNVRSEEHTSELQSRQYLVCRLLLE